MTAPRWIKRTQWTGGNLDTIRGMNARPVELNYRAPPFNSNRSYVVPIGSETAGSAFKDT